ncbi:hypothetical protein NDU88_003950 [Pleurodeles waltl]|uniref:Uncharacterized protein n=1 Tax=Pleurodeles waltl TaxID=8319 RepID=A0AAV7M6H5_PLEWA|nr:hypothetical protein NDU88_003950 [Pleurodeles waltl]
MLKTLQPMVDTTDYYLAEIDIQIELLNMLAVHVAVIKGKIVDLNKLIKKAQEDAMELTPRCMCLPILEEFSARSVTLSVLSDDLKAVKNQETTERPSPTELQLILPGGDDPESQMIEPVAQASYRSLSLSFQPCLL